ncbi:hypothetical protein GCM10010464_04230 [Pseudonocardia yunnanensis]|uniref:Immunity protein Imm1 n=1 Tax=Pseudonocardia yunnanensis TaxID=58107 RepID=A0ABW4EY56_9PSEU
MHTYEELLTRARAVVDLLDARWPVKDDIVNVDANTADEDNNSAWAIYEIDATTYLGIERNDDRLGILCLFLHDEGWQIDMHIEEDAVELPLQPHFPVDADPESVADYVRLALDFAEPTLRN